MTISILRTAADFFGQTKTRSLTTAGFLLIFCLAFDLYGPSRQLQAQSGAVAGNPGVSTDRPTSFDADDSINRLITSLVLRHLPHSYTRDKDWGHQSERWDGIKWERDGLRLKTKRRKKLVNHGTWQMYSAELIDPRQQFEVVVANIHKSSDGKLAFQVKFTTRIKLHARQSKWVKGVQLYSISADGKAAVRLTVDMQLAIAMDATRFPPDLLFSPQATSANLIVDEFRIDHVSKLGGEFSQQVTRLVRRELDDEIEEKETELVKKINKEIAEESDDFRLALSEACQTRWTEKATAFLPPAVKQAVESGRQNQPDGEELSPGHQE